nr:LysR substrate-binding domain-containing protein [Olsenella uli]
MGLCCPRYPGVERLVALVSAVSARAVGREVRTSLTSCADALEELRSGRVDALVTLAPLEAGDVTCGSLGTLASSVLLAADHPLAAREELTIGELGAYPLLCPVDYDHFVFSVVRPYLERGLASPVVEVEVDGEAGERGGVPEGFCGYAFQVAADITGTVEGCVSRPVAAPEMVPVPIFLSTLRGSGSVDFVVFRRALSRMLALA